VLLDKGGPEGGVGGGQEGVVDCVGVGGGEGFEDGEFRRQNLGMRKYNRFCSKAAVL
jgi:hypothetical protein